MRPPVLESIATPALVLDGSTLQTNVKDMALRAQLLGVELRPHAKTHKSIAIAALQREHGARGLTVATVEEAECFAAAGFDDLLLTMPPVGGWRNRRIARLAKDVLLRIVLDSATAATALDDACRVSGVRIGFLWEVDCGLHRFGTPPGAATVTAITETMRTLRHASFDGLLAFGGHAYGAVDDAAIRAAAADERGAVAETAALLKERGVETVVRSIGTTPTSHRMTATEGITEIRPGNYVFHDATQVAMGIVELDRCAVTVAATVVSRPTPDRLILDAGSKALGADRMSPLTEGFGLVVGHPELVIDRLFEEQAIVAIKDTCGLAVGDRVRVVPNHSCATANLHEEYLVVEEDEVVDVWPLVARRWRTPYAYRRIAEAV